VYLLLVGVAVVLSLLYLVVAGRHP
jgi:hypothetical protein